MSVFYIVPTIDKKGGPQYEILKYRETFFGGEKLIGPLSVSGSVDYIALQLDADVAKQFTSVPAAIEFIRENYGEKAKIGKWRAM